MNANAGQTSLTWRISAIQFLSIVVVSALTFLSSMTISYFYLEQLFEDKAEILFGSVENELVMFDHALNLVEADWEEELQTGMPKLANTLGTDYDRITELPPSMLKQIARDHNLTDIYLINKDLEVTAASFEPDIGLDMTRFTDEYTRYLKELLNKGEVGVDRISVSTETGELKKYAYYSAPGSGFIINADIGVYDRIASNEQSSAIVNSLYQDVTQRFTARHSELLDLDVFMISRVDQWSLFNEGRQLSREIADRLYAGNPVQVNEQDSLTLFRKVPFDRYDSMGYRIYAMVTLDQSARSRLLVQALWYSLLGTIAVVAVTWLLSYFLLQRVIVNRFDTLMRQMTRISDVHGTRIDLDGYDEITEIGMKMNEMLTRIETESHQRDLFENLSHIDALTRVANRRRLDEVLVNEVSRVSRDLGSMSVIMLDIDWFKGYNDYYGHLAGDEALRNVANILSQCTQRPSDLVARYGGEEFICVVPGTDRETGEQLAKSIVNHVFDAQIPNQASPLAYLSVSAGCLFVASGQTCTPEQVLAQVDALLYQSKYAGKHRFHVADFSARQR